MNKDEKASISVRKIVIISVLLMFLFSATVMASAAKLNAVKIILSNSQEMDVLTTKTKVSEILDENSIIVLPEENVVPDLESEISEENNVITITSSKDKQEIINLAQESEDITLDSVLSGYTPIVERIIIEQVTIPYETITKDGSASSTTTTSKVVQKGKDGLKEIKYSIKYQNDIEIERTILEEKIIIEPVNKIVNITKTTARNEIVRTTTISAVAMEQKVAGITPEIKKLNTSAYTASTCDKSPDSPSYGITSSGVRATAWCTVAAGSAYPVGTIIYIPYFKDKPNGGWFIVQDRGGAIKNNKLDVYMNTYNECVKFGRKNIECYIYKMQ